MPPVFSYSTLLSDLGINPSGMSDLQKVQTLSDLLNRDSVASRALLSAFGSSAMRSGFAYQSGTPANTWSGSSTTFSGWAGLAGTPGAFNRIDFDLLPFDPLHPVRTVRVRIKDGTNGNAGLLLADVIQPIYTIPNQSSPISIDLGATINNGSNPIWVEVLTDGYCGIRMLTAAPYVAFPSQYWLGSHIADLQAIQIIGGGAQNFWFGFNTTGGSIRAVSSPADTVFPFKTTNFSAWAGPIGSQQNFNRIGCFLLPYDANFLPTRCRVRIISGTDQTGPVVADKTVGVQTRYNEQFWLSVDLDSPVLNSAVGPLWFEIYSDGRVAFLRTTVVAYPAPTYHILRLGTDAGVVNQPPTMVDSSGGNQGIFVQTSFVDPKSKTLSSGDLISAIQQSASDMFLTSLGLPGMIYAVQGLEASLYLENEIRRNKPDQPTRIEDYEVNIDCQYGSPANYLGQQQNLRWTATPATADVGDQVFTFSAYAGGQLAASKSITLRIRAPMANPLVNRKLLAIGDSLTQGGVWLSELVRLASNGGITLTTVGTVQSVGIPDSTTTNRTVNHEGRGGYTFQNYWDNSQPSPFFIGGVFNFGQYLANNGIALVAGDWVSFLLGPNDVLTALSDAAVGTILSNTLTYLNGMITSIRAAVAGVRICLCLPTLPAHDQDAFGANYGNGQTRWRYDRNIKLLREWLINNYSGSGFGTGQNSGFSTANLLICDMGGALDVRNNMQVIAGATNAYNNTQVSRASNALHPANSGQYQMGAAKYYFLRGQET